MVSCYHRKPFHDYFRANFSDYRSEKAPGEAVRAQKLAGAGAVSRE
jgi:hypothetical protein